MPTFDNKVEDRLKELILMGEKVRSSFRLRARSTFYDRDQSLTWHWITMCLNFISRVVGKNTEHYRVFESSATKEYITNPFEIEQMQGVMLAVKSDVEAGFLFDRDLLITAEAFNDVLEQAEYLLENKYKDAAAVIVGAALESTLRKMCDRRGIEVSSRDGIDSLNIKLATADAPAYNKLVQKQITAWADLRNNAAHGHYDKYTHSNVEDMDKWVRSFIEQHMA
jgi:hypothetical protein